MAGFISQTEKINRIIYNNNNNNNNNKIKFFVNLRLQIFCEESIKNPSAHT